MTWHMCDECGRPFMAHMEHDILCDHCYAALEDAEMEDDFEADSGVFCGACGLMVQEVRNGLCRECASKPKGAA